MAPLKRVLAPAVDVLEGVTYQPFQRSPVSRGSPFAQSEVRTELVKVRTDDGVILHGPR